jgi:hypothetical protein
MSISKRICRFMMHIFISTRGKYHKPCHMAGCADLCDWCNDEQSKLRQVHDHFKYFDNISSYRLVYELLILAYCYIYLCDV